MSAHKRRAAGALVALLIISSCGIRAAEPCTPRSDPSGKISASAAIAACGGSGWIRLEGEYVLDAPVHLSSGALLEGPSPGRKAKLIASPSFGNQVILSAKGSRIEVRNIVVSGNKAERRYDVPIAGIENGQAVTHYLCDADGWRPPNAKFEGSDIDIHDFESIDAPCGSGLGVSADRLRLWNFRVADNGFEAPEERNGQEGKRPFPDRSHQYSDGITVEYCGGCVFADGLLAENTDLDFVLGGGPNNHVYNVHCVHRSTYGFGCFNIGRFDTGRGWDGNHQGLVLENNSVSAGFERLSLGLSIGGRFFTNDVTHVVVHDAGTVQNNRIDGSQIGIAVDAVEKGQLLDNAVGSVQGSRGNFNHCQLAMKYVVGNVKGAVVLQPGYVRMTMHGGACVAL